MYVLTSTVPFSSQAGPAEFVKLQHHGRSFSHLSYFLPSYLLNQILGFSFYFSSLFQFLLENQTLFFKANTLSPKDSPLFSTQNLN